MGIFNALIGAGAKAVEGGAEGVKYLATQQLDKNLKLDLAKEMAEIDMQKQLRIDEVTGRRNTERQKELSTFNEELRTNAPDFKLGMEQTEQSMDLAQQSADLEKEKFESRRLADAESIATSKQQRELNEITIKQAREVEQRIQNYEKAMADGNPEKAAQIKKSMIDKFNLLNPGNAQKLFDSLIDLATIQQKIITDDDSSKTDKETAARKLAQIQSSIDSLYKSVLPKDVKSPSSDYSNVGLIGGVLKGKYNTLPDYLLNYGDLYMDGEKINPQDFIQSSDGKSFTRIKNPLRRLGGEK